MFRQAILFAVGALALAFIAPSLMRAPGAGPTAPPAAAADANSALEPAGAAPERPARESVGFRETTLRADPRGQYSADVEINGMPVPMLVDTGASVVSISAATARRLGVTPSEGPKWRITTANGVSTASPVVLDNVSFGGLYMRDVQALILAPEAGDVNLLGASFLKRLMSVESRDGLLILRQ